MRVRNNYGGICILCGLTLLAAGCGTSTSTDANSGSTMDAMAAALDTQKASQQQEQAQMDAEQQAQESQAAAEAESSRTVAGRPGVGEGGYFTAIVGARRHVLNRVEDLAWLQGVQHFQAEHGRLPKDHDEFMSRIVQPLGINLGYKEENQEFLYDPSQGQWGEVFVVEKVEQTAQPDSADTLSE
jgi:hypothetical protein